MAKSIVNVSYEDAVSWKPIISGIDDADVTNWNNYDLYMGESLKTPGLQTTVRIQSANHTLPVKNLDKFKGQSLNITLHRPSLSRFNLPDTLEVSQTIYRIDRRTTISPNTEEYYIHACDPSLLVDAATHISKHFKCKTPSEVTTWALKNCLGVPNLVVEESAPPRDYWAENIHPFQVVAQQAEAALANGMDPSFVHYMTYENLGTHKFESLYSMTKKPPVMNFILTEATFQSGYGFPYGIMYHEFPCDFDLLSDILNGLDGNGRDLSSVTTFDPVTKSFNMFGEKNSKCGLGAGIVNETLSNMTSDKTRDACPDYTHMYLQKRQARMSLIDNDQIGLRLTVPWNPVLNAGKTINVLIQNKESTSSLVPNYGSGTYLIVALKHEIGYGGYGTITMDCVSQTVGGGVL